MVLRGAIVLAGLAVTAFGAALAWAEILISTVSPYAGQNIYLGEQSQQGAEMAGADINADGGDLGRSYSIKRAT